MEVINPLLDEDSINTLSTEYQLLHLLYHRNINQHRSSIWWKHFNILHRKIRQILLLFIDIDELTSTGVLRKCEFKKGNLKVVSKRTVNEDQKRKVIIKKQSEITALASYVVKKLLPDCYYRFFSVIELGQFIALGFVLIGLISRFYAVLIKIEGTKKVNKQLEEKFIKSQNVENIAGYEDHDGLGEEIGEIVDLKSLDLERETPPEIKQNTKSEKNKNKIKNKRALELDDTPVGFDSEKLGTKKKKKVSVMDDIFGASTPSDSSSEKSKDKKKKKKKSKSAMSDIFGF